MMGMDIYGNEPKNECGKYFGISAWGWRPLVTYMRELAPEITAKCKLWFYNDFDGLNGEDSTFLADVLQKEIDSGRTEKYARLWNLKRELAPSEPCYLCEGTGTRKPAPECGAGEPTGDGIFSNGCNGCNGAGYRRPSIDPFSLECAREFASFLRYCGGFQIV